MTAELHHVSPHSDLAAPDALGWLQFLRGRVAADWRPGQFDFDGLVYRPDPDDQYTLLGACLRPECGIFLNGGDICPSCRKEWKRDTRESQIGKQEWAAGNPRRRLHERKAGCLVEECLRAHHRHGLCVSHATNYEIHRAREGTAYAVTQWVDDRQPKPLPPRAGCVARVCGREAVHRSGMCGHHNQMYQDWRNRTAQGHADESVALWLAREVEPPMDPETLATYAKACATPFGLLPEPLRWEFLYAVQARDLGGRAKLNAVQVRGTYLHLRRQGWDSVVGMTELGRRSGMNANLAGMLVQWQRLIDDAHREWSGTDARDAKVLYLRDLEIRETSKVIGPGARMDLRGIQGGWILDSVSAWARAAARGHDALLVVAHAWTVADEVLQLRGTPRNALGVADMDAIVRQIRERWPRKETQARRIKAVDRVVKYSRGDDALQDHWAVIPARFAIDPARHQAIDKTDTASPNRDEPFRFVPQPSLDWVMDHLHVIDRGDPYLIAESQAMIYVHERCGRRTGETVRLRDDCITYDNQGSPYLEWRRGKPPYTMGKRLPIHQETHDLIRQWQEIKRERDIKSGWLFPSLRYTTADKPYDTSYLGTRVSELVRAVQEHAPFEGPVEGVEGNLVHFDLTTIDPYAFRHAFAQRLADATDADGRPTTPPDVLQDYMGHKNFNTTMAYYEVTAKRRKKALEAIPPRRLNLRGHVVDVDRERDGFTRIAVTLGHCSEPQNVAAGGHGCMLEHACESCPFFMVDPLERDGMDAKRQDLRVKLERARVIHSPGHILDHYQARIADCTRVIDGIDAYVDALPAEERSKIEEALEHMSDIRRRATAPRKIDLRAILRRESRDGV